MRHNPPQPRQCGGTPSAVVPPQPRQKERKRAGGGDRKSEGYKKSDRPAEGLSDLEKGKAGKKIDPTTAKGVGLEKD